MAFSLSFLSAHCHPTPVLTDPSDGGLEGSAVANDCAASCANQRKLQCPGATGKSSPGQHSCEDVCTAQTGEFVLQPKCVAAAKDCKELLACFGQ